MHRTELKNRLRALNLSIYEASILLGFSHPNRIYSGAKISRRTEIALERLELLNQIGKLQDERNKFTKAVNRLTKRIRNRQKKSEH